ncbi:MAG: extracellular solute-binding protein [Verrucomicrobiae bacterium]|nr:extracellular solute-binding protein [Verrucomicrobiae bacterium]
MEFKATTKSDQLHDFLKQEIQKEVFKPLQRIPSERILAEDFHLARPTVHKVLSNLVAEGILYRKLGQGTFVASQSSQKTILSICILTPSLQPECVKNLFELFEQKHPKVEIKTHYFSAQEAANADFWRRQPGFDLLMVGEFMAGSLIQRGILADLTGRVDADCKPDLFRSIPFSLFSKEGSCYAVPIAASPIVLFCNCRLFREAGVSIGTEPMTWEDFLEKARRLTDPAKGQYGFAFSNHRNRWPVLLMKRGASIFDATGACVADRPAVREALQWCLDLVWRHQVAPSPLIDANQLFARGKVAMLMGTGYCMPLFKHCAGLEYEIVPMPGNPAEPTGLMSMGFGIAEESPRKELAWDFILQVVSEEVQTSLYRANYALPVRKIPQQDQSPEFQMLDREMSRSHPIYPGPESYRAIEMLTEELKLFWANTQSVDDVLSAFENMRGDPSPSFSIPFQ